MIPQLQEDLTADVTYESQPTYTYEMNIENDKVVGNCDGISAMEQAAYKILNTERYHNVIYSWNYGVELADLAGKPTSFCVPEIERRITEALLQDDRINAVKKFIFSFPRKQIIHVRFEVETTEGNFTMQKEVNV